MAHYYASADGEGIESVIETLRSTSFEDDDVSVSVMDGNVVMRCIDLDEVRDRNLTGYMGDEVCSLKYDGTRLTVSFHESQVDGTFSLTPTGSSGFNANQASDIKALAPLVGDVLDMLERYVDVVAYDFTEVSAASIASGGHFCDFEFEYVVTTSDL